MPQHYVQRKVREKSRECHNQKPHPFPDIKRKRKQTKPNKRRSNKQVGSGPHAAEVRGMVEGPAILDKDRVRTCCTYSMLHESLFNQGYFMVKG